MTLDIERFTIPRSGDREEWLAQRRPYVNASAAGVLLNRHPFLTLGDYYTEKVTGQEREQTAAMRRGIRLESVIADWWAEEFGGGTALVEPTELYVGGPFMATLDRWAQDLDSPLEIKSANSYVSSPPPYWLDQCQVQMLCTGADTCQLVWFDATMQLQERTIAEDPALQAELVDRAQRFLASVEFGIEPEDLSYQNIVALHPNPVGAVELDDAALEFTRELATARRIKRDAGKDEDLLKDKLARVLGDHEAGHYHGHEIVTWRTSAATSRLNVDMLAADYPDLVERYSFPVAGSRRMLVKLGEE